MTGDDHGDLEGTIKHFPNRSLHCLVHSSTFARLILNCGLNVGVAPSSNGMTCPPPLQGGSPGSSLNTSLYSSKMFCISGG